MQDLEILELHFGVQATVLALAAMERSMIENDSMKLEFIALNFLEALRDHINSISNVPRKVSSYFLIRVHMCGSSFIFCLLYFTMMYF